MLTPIIKFYALQLFLKLNVQDVSDKGYIYASFRFG